MAFLESCQRFVVAAHVLVTEAELVERHRQIGRNLQCLAVLRYSLLVLALVVQGPADAKITRDRQRLELQRPPHFPCGLFQALQREQAVAVPQVCARAAGSACNRTFELFLRAKPVPFVRQLHISLRRMGLRHRLVYFECLNGGGLGPRHRLTRSNTSYPTLPSMAYASASPACAGA